MITEATRRRAARFLRCAPVAYEKMVDRISGADRGQLRRHFEIIAERAAFLARYLDERHGRGCGDQGHEAAAAAGNKAARAVWCKVFGYNDHHAIMI